MPIKNLVGHVVPTPEQTQQIDAALDTVQGGIETFCTAIAASDRGGVLRPRAGSEKLMPLVFEVARRKGLAVDGMPLDGVDDDLKVASAADRYELRLEALRQRVADTRLVAYGEAYQAFLAYYGILSSMAKHDPALETELRPVVDFMSTGPRTRR
jgi:hypothetical protein